MDVHKNVRTTLWSRALIAQRVNRAGSPETRSVENRHTVWSCLTVIVSLHELGG